VSFAFDPAPQPARGPKRPFKRWIAAFLEGCGKPGTDTYFALYAAVCPRFFRNLLVVALTIVVAHFVSQEDVEIGNMSENNTVISPDGTTIAFTRLGEGPPLILVDGAFCFRENGPTPKLAPLLARHFTVYAYDRRGRGGSRDTKPYAVEREVEDLKAVVDAAGGSALVFGMSSGAALALHAAANGVRIKRLALYEPPYVTANDGAPRQFASASKHLEALASSGERTEAVTYFMTEIFGAPKPFVYGMRLFMRGVWKKNESVAHTLPYDLTIINDWSVLKASSSIIIPTLVIGGEKSPEKLRKAVDTVVAAVPGSHRRVLTGQDHNVDMKVLAPVLAEFFSAAQ
jgi:pimeloyl-ACP methyl ester carboxylesterase